MPLFSRSRRGFAPLSRFLPRTALAREERVVAWAQVAPDAAIVATTYGLFLPGRDSRLGWHEIHKATWDGESLTIVPAEPVQHRADYLVTADGPPVVVPLPRPGKLPDQVRARVTRSVAYTRWEALAGGGGVRIVARRVPGVDGRTWTVRYEDGADPDAPGVAAATDELVAAARPE